MQVIAQATSCGISTVVHKHVAHTVDGSIRRNVKAASANCTIGTVSKPLCITYERLRGTIHEQTSSITTHMIGLKMTEV